MTRRAVFLGAAVAGTTAIGWKIKKSQRLRCFLWPVAHPSGGELLGVIGREKIFADAPFAECHASTLAVAGSTLVCAWFGAKGQLSVALSILAALALAQITAQGEMAAQASDALHRIASALRKA